MAPSCPITKDILDEHAARATAGLVFTTALSALILASPWLATLLALDFAARSLGARRWSPFAVMARRVLALLRVRPRPVNAGAKQFAARVGLVFSIVILGALLLDLSFLAWLFGAALATCAFLEGTFGYCVGCRLYSLWIAAFPAAAGGDAVVDSREGKART
jgi:hypothetical protein